VKLIHRRTCIYLLFGLILHCQYVCYFQLKKFNSIFNTMSWLVLPSDYCLVGQYYGARFGAKAWDTEYWRKERVRHIRILYLCMNLWGTSLWGKGRTGIKDSAVNGWRSVLFHKCRIVLSPMLTAAWVLIKRQDWAYLFLEDLKNYFSFCTIHKSAFYLHGE
jgi:hypothetical protein